MINKIGAEEAVIGMKMKGKGLRALRSYNNAISCSSPTHTACCVVLCDSRGQTRNYMAAPLDNDIMNKNKLGSYSSCIVLLNLIMNHATRIHFTTFMRQPHRHTHLNYGANSDGLFSCRNINLNCDENQPESENSDHVNNHHSSDMKQ